MKNLELFTLKIFNIWDPAENENFWEAIIEIPVTYSLYDFHEYIQEIIDFDNDHLFDFYAGRNERNRNLVFSEDSGYPGDGGDYDNIFLKDIYPLNGLKLYYLFDYGDNWIFAIHKLRKKAIHKEGEIYPRIVSQKGDKPVQYVDYNFNDDEE